MNALPSIVAVVGGLAAILSIWLGRWASRAGMVAGWLGVLAAGFGLQSGVGASAGLGTLAGAISMKGLVPMIGMAACGALAVAPGWHHEDGPVPTVVAGVVAAGLGAVALGVGGSFAVGPWQRGAVLLGAYATAWVAGVAGVAGGACMAVVGWIREARARRKDEEDGGAGDAQRLARSLTLRGMLVAWLAWPLAALIHWRFLGTPWIGSTGEWWGAGFVLAATGLAVAAFQKTRTRAAGRVVEAAPLATLLILGVAVVVPLTSGHLPGLSLPL